MKSFLFPAVLLSATVVLCSAGQTTHVYAILTDKPDIMNNGWMKLTCDADKVGLSSNADVVQLELRRTLESSLYEDAIATYRPSSQPNPGLSIAEKFKNDTRWTIKGYGQEPTGPTDSFYMTAVVNKTLCSDYGKYSCYVNYIDKDRKEEEQIEGFELLASIAEITKIEFNGKDNNRTDTGDVHKDDVITVDCSVKGPLYKFNLTWQKNGKVIGDGYSPPEVLQVEYHEPIPLKIVDKLCPQYQFNTTLVFKARPSTFNYQCNWKTLGRNGNATFDMESAGWKWSSPGTLFAGRKTQVYAKLTDKSDIMNNGSMELTCDSKKVGLSSNTGVVQLELRRQLTWSTTQETIASYRPSSQPNPGLSIAEKFKDNERWTIKGYGQKPTGPTDSFYMTAVVNKTLCSDSGIYSCFVNYTDDESKEEHQIEGLMLLPSIAIITKIELTGKNDNRTNTSDVHKDDVISVDCYVKGPLYLVLTWQQDGKIIGVNNSPPEVLKVENREAIPLSAGDCPQYQYHNTLVFKARPSTFDYQCNWTYKDRNGSATFDVESAGWKWTSSAKPRRKTQVYAKLTDISEIMNNGWMELTCDAERVGLSSNADVVQLELRRELTWSTTQETIASYRPSSLPNPGLSIADKFKNDTRWTIKGYGQEPTGPTDSFYMTALINKTLCSDSGIYSCVVDYTAKDTEEENQIEGLMLNLPSIAEITKIELTGKNNNRNNTSDVHRDDEITVDCYVKGPPYLELIWQQDGKVIGVNNSAPEVLKVENHEATPLSAGDCPQYQYHHTLVFKARPSTFDYQCNWTYKDRNGSKTFDVESAGWKWTSSNRPGRKTQVYTKLTYKSDIMNNGSMELTCDAKKVGLSSNTGVVQLELRRQLTWSTTQETIASYRPSSQPAPGLSIAEKFKDNERWTINGYGQKPTGPTDSFYMTAVVNKTLCSDSGIYSCFVNYTDEESKEENQIEGMVLLPSIAEITKIELIGENNNRTNTSDVHKDDVITVDCYVKGPLFLVLNWQQDGKVIGVNNSPPEVLKVENREATPLSAGDCPQYQYQNTLVFKARPSTFDYQCNWNYKDRNGSETFDVESAGWKWSSSGKPGRKTQVYAKLTDKSDIMNNGSMELTCDAKKVGLSSNAGVVQLELRRQLTWSTSQETIALYRPSSQPNPGLSIAEKFKDNERWTINGYGQEPTGPTDSFYMTAVVNKTLCSDSGIYSCFVNYTDEESNEENQIEGLMLLPSIAEITKTKLVGENNNRTNTSDVHKDDVITVDCYVKGPLYLVLTWQQDGKVIGVNNSPPEVLNVENREATPLSAGDCPQYQYHNTLVFKARPSTFDYQCNWNYKDRNGSATFDVESAGWKWSSSGKPGRKSKVYARLTDKSDIMNNGSMKLTCDAKKVGLSLNTGVVQLELRRQLTWKISKETIASYRPSSQLNPGLSIAEKFKNDTRWTIKGYGQEPTGPTDSFYMTAVVNKTLCNDGGIYSCFVNYTDEESKEENQIEGVMLLQSIAEITKIELVGENNNRTNTSDVHKEDVITVDCYVKGPLFLALTWQQDGKVIGVNNSPPEVLKVENREGMPLSAGGCPQYQYHNTLVFKAGPSTFDYQCNWKYKDRNGSATFDVESAGWKWSSSGKPAQNSTAKRVKLTEETDIMDNGWMKLTCDAKTVGLSSNADVLRLELRRTLTSTLTQETIASYTPSSQPNPGLSIAKGYRHDQRWTIKGYGQEPTGPTDSFYMTAVVNKTLCHDGGEYYCIATYTDKESKEEKQIEGLMLLPSIAEITTVEVSGYNNNGSVFGEVKKDDVISVNCTVKGPIYLNVAWKKDGKVIGVDISPPEVIKVENRGAIPISGGDCPQWEFYRTLTFKAKPDTFEYQCAWYIDSRNGSAVFDMDSANWKWSSLTKGDASGKTSDSKSKGFNLWYAIAPTVAVVVLIVIGAGIYLIVVMNRKRLSQHEDSIKLTS